MNGFSYGSRAGSPGRYGVASGARRRHLSISDTHDDPTSAVVNLFDLALLIGVGLLIMALTSFGLKEILSDDEITIVKNPGRPNMELIHKKGDKIQRMTGTGQKVKVEGVPIGTVYQLPNGDTIWLPNGPGNPSSPANPGNPANPTK